MQLGFTLGFLRPQECCTSSAHSGRRALAKTTGFTECVRRRDHILPAAVRVPNHRCLSAELPRFRLGGPRGCAIFFIFCCVMVLSSRLQFHARRTQAQIPQRPDQYGPFYLTILFSDPNSLIKGLSSALEGLIAPPGTSTKREAAPAAQELSIITRVNSKRKNTKKRLARELVAPRIIRRPVPVGLYPTSWFGHPVLYAWKPQTRSWVPSNRGMV